MSDVASVKVRHSRVSLPSTAIGGGNPAKLRESHWTPACAGVTE
jgi:hypothetical protein